MKNSKAKEIIVPAVSLFLICVVVTALLALTNAVTAPKIDALAVETQDASKKQVLSSAASFSEEKQVEKDGVSYTYYDGLASDGSVMGYVFVTSAKGYGGDISVMVGVLGDGTVAGVNTLSINETAGLGMNAKNQSFLDQFLGKSGEIGVAKNNPSDTEIQALTGATITSSAMATAVNTALSLYAEIGGGQNG
ncbi:MAG TPA: RnfABCDGE type electron transport complex subunit G [Candidatus Fimenecus excrementavium]|nr:RnfABCDGE type electron transport complex subunit G [Candidatus Fimenecus excrementavium]